MWFSLPKLLAAFSLILPILHRLLFLCFISHPPLMTVSLLFAGGSDLMEKFITLSLVWPFSSMDPG